MGSLALGSFFSFLRGGFEVEMGQQAIRYANLQVYLLASVVQSVNSINTIYEIFFLANY